MLSGRGDRQRATAERLEGIKNKKFNLILDIKLTFRFPKKCMDGHDDDERKYIFH